MGGTEADRDRTDCRDLLEESRAETRAAFENRAIVYFHMYNELKNELGAEQAAEVMSRAIRRRGTQIAEAYREAAEAGDLEEVGRIFCETSAAQGELFRPDVKELSEDRIVLSMEACPLCDAWESLGLAEDEVDTLCEIAAAVDAGTFEGAGLEFAFLERRGHPSFSRCLIELRTPEGA
jgi:predicted ArsR family transcriptional regulator